MNMCAHSYTCTSLNWPSQNLYKRLLSFFTGYKNAPAFVNVALKQQRLLKGEHYTKTYYSLALLAIIVQEAPAIGAGLQLRADAYLLQLAGRQDHPAPLAGVLFYFGNGSSLFCSSHRSIAE